MNSPALREITQMSWGVLRWKNMPQCVDAYPFRCDECGAVADMPCARLIGGKVAAVLPGNRLVITPFDFDPPPNFLPDRVECPHCRQTYHAEDTEGGESK